MTQTPVIVAAARTPIGRAFKGSLKDERSDVMVANIIKAALDQVPAVIEDSLLDEILVGCGSPGGEQGFNIARVAGVLLGHDTVPGATVNRYCASSVQTARQAAHTIIAGEAKFVVAAGVESTSSYSKGEADSIPNTMNPIFADAQERTERRSGESTVIWSDPRIGGHLPDIYIDMGQTAENVANVYGVSRQDQDDYALLSQQRTKDSIDRGFWNRDITPYTTSSGETVVVDDSPRPTTTAEGLAGLQPAFRESGSVTAGNSCPLSDGASALVIAGDKDARTLGLEPKARIVGSAVTALSPEIMGMGPVDSVNKVLVQAGMKLGDIDLVEINEAFAAQVVACQRELKIPIDKLNVNGGGIAIGHPFGATGGRITNTMINSLEDRDLERGLISMCVGGGQGMAMMVERI